MIWCLEDLAERDILSIECTDDTLSRRTSCQSEGKVLRGREERLMFFLRFLDL